MCLYAQKLVTENTAFIHPVNIKVNAINKIYIPDSYMKKCTEHFIKKKIFKYSIKI